MHIRGEVASRIERPLGQGVDGLSETGRGSKSGDISYISSKDPVFCRLKVRLGQKPSEVSIPACGLGGIFPAARSCQAWQIRTWPMESALQEQVAGTEATF